MRRCAADGRYEEVVRLQKTLCKIKEEFQQLQLSDVDKDQAQQRFLYGGATKVDRARGLNGLRLRGRM